MRKGRNLDGGNHGQNLGARGHSGARRGLAPGVHPVLPELEVGLRFLGGRGRRRRRRLRRLAEAHARAILRVLLRHGLLRRRQRVRILVQGLSTLTLIQHQKPGPRSGCDVVVPQVRPRNSRVCAARERHIPPPLVLLHRPLDPRVAVAAQHRAGHALVHAQQKLDGVPGLAHKMLQLHGLAVRLQRTVALGEMQHRHRGTRRNLPLHAVAPRRKACPVELLACVADQVLVGCPHALSVDVVRVLRLRAFLHLRIPQRERQGGCHPVPVGIRIR
mmetsp:Transcript_159200/g.510665  ORF Transcript_159200/g.510665 Transcript_159200/m.510665 type:complete len:274 (+) Transcript_159200:1193-2014(+)